MTTDEDFDIDDEVEQDESEQPTQGKGLRKALDREKDEKRKAKAERDEARKELAFLKAGVDTSTPIGALFAKGYDGPTDPESVKAAFAAIAPAPTTSKPETTTQTESEETMDETPLTPEDRRIAEVAEKLRGQELVPGRMVTDPLAAALSVRGGRDDRMAAWLGTKLQAS